MVDESSMLDIKLAEALRKRTAPLEVLEARTDGRELVVRTPTGTGAQRELVVEQRASAEGAHVAHRQRSAPLRIACVRA